MSTQDKYTPTPLHKRSGVIGRRDAEVLFPWLKHVKPDKQAVYWVNRGQLYQTKFCWSGGWLTPDTYRFIDDGSSFVVDRALPPDVFEALVCEYLRLRGKR